MKLKLKHVLLIPSFLIFISSSHAKPVSMILYYPGGQGSQEQAQSILDSFSEAIKRNSQGQFEPKITYISDTQEGVGFIQSQKPALGILSYDVFLQKGKDWNAEVVAQSLQLPSADGKDQYFLLGTDEKILSNGQKITIYSSRPLDSTFIQKSLFPQLGANFELKTSPSIVSKLRNIGQGNEVGLVLLDQFEQTNVSKLKTPWAQNLKTLAQSAKIPSSPVVVFKDSFPPADLAALQETLAKVSKDPQAQETLQLLRLKGFKKSSSSELSQMK